MIHQMGTTGSQTLSSNHDSSIPNIKKPDRPSVDIEISETQWAFFLDEWATYKTQAHLSRDADVITELRSCCSSDLRRSLFDFMGPTDPTVGEQQLLNLIKQCAVQGKTVAVHRHEFHPMAQAHGQRLHDYVTKLKSKAGQCRFFVPCPNPVCCTRASLQRWCPTK